MVTITIPKREYEDLKAAKRKLSVLLRTSFFPAERDKSMMLGRAFGIFKKEFGKKIPFCMSIKCARHGEHKGVLF